MRHAAYPCVVTLVFLLGSFFFVAPVRADESSAVAAYHKLASADVEAKRAATPPDFADWKRVDASAQVRSASFGHKTTLIVSPSGNEFYVEYGRSTNRPSRLFGPFTISK